MLGRVSEQAAAVIYNSTRFEQTEHESHTDPLTGLANRRSLDRQFEAGLARAARTKGSVSVVVLDLDRLKEINDTYGHEAGDRALRAVGTVLRTTVRQNDLCARFAGDEFIVVLWDCSPDHEAAPRARAADRGRRASVRAAAGRPRVAVDQRRRRALPEDGTRSTSCWRRPTSGCITTRPGAARAIPAGRRRRAARVAIGRG